MSTFEDLKAAFKRRLLAATHKHLLGHLETTISGYEKELERKRKLVETIRKRRADVQQMLATTEDLAGCQWSSDQDQDKPEPSHIKEQQTNNKVLMDCGGSESPDFNNKAVSGDSDKDRKKLHRRFGCSECGKQFKQRAGLKIHMRSHTGEKPFSCSVCGKGFAQSVSLRYHLKIHTGEKPFSCSVCGRSFRQKGTLKMHMLTHTGDAGFGCVMTEDSSQASETRKKPQNCSECGETFPNKYLLVTHMRMHKGKKLFTCSVCGVHRQFSSQMDIHMRRHTGERPYSCSICGKTFTQRGIMMQHMAVHSGVKPYSCSKCGRRFYWHFQIKKHKCDGTPARNRSAFSEIDCSRSQPVRDLVHSKHLICDQRRKTSETDDTEFWKDVRQHQTGFTYQRKQKVSVTDTCKSEKKLFICTGDGRQLKSEDVSVSDADKKQVGSESHKGSEDGHSPQTRCQTGEKPFSCFFCGKGCASGGCLTRHISLHTGENLLRCVMCEKRFTSLSELKSHRCVGDISQLRRSQMEEQTSTDKPLSCPQCGKRFGRKQQLQVHMRIHKAGNRFSCSVCGKIFSKRQSLSSHMTCHTEQDSICCSVCNAGFSHRESLIQHMRIHTRQTQFSCSVCGKEFAWRRNLTKHMDVHAKEKISGADGEFLRSSSSETDQSADSDFWTKTRRRLSDPTEDQVCDGRPDKPSDSLNAQSETASCSDCSQTKGEHPEPPHIKEEEEEVWSSLEEEQLPGPEEFLFSRVPVKSEDDEEKPQSSQLHQSRTEDNRDSETGPGPDRDSGPDRQLAQNSDCSEPDSVDSDFFKETRDRGSRSNSKNSERGQKTLMWSDDRSPPAESADSVDIDFWKETRKSQLEPDEVSDRGVKKPFSCSDCGKTFLYIFHLNSHKKSHRRQSPLSCSVCGQKCLYESHLKIHMRTHTGEKPFGCPVCGKKYAHKASMQSHLTVHSLNRRYSCGVCGRSFGWFTELKYHRCEAEPGSGGGAGAVPEETSKSHGHWFIHTNM